MPPRVKPSPTELAMGMAPLSMPQQGSGLAAGGNMLQSFVQNLLGVRKLRSEETLAQTRAAMEQERLGMDRSRLELEGRRVSDMEADTKAAAAAAEQKQTELQEAANAYLTDPDIGPSLQAFKNSPSEVVARGRRAVIEKGVEERRQATQADIAARQQKLLERGTVSEGQAAQSYTIMKSAAQEMEQIEKADTSNRVYDEVSRTVAAWEAADNIPLNFGQLTGSLGRRLGMGNLSPEAQRYLLNLAEINKEGAFARGGQQLTATELAQTLRVYSPYMHASPELKKAIVRRRRTFISSAGARAGLAREGYERRLSDVYQQDWGENLDEWMGGSDGEEGASEEEDEILLDVEEFLQGGVR